MAYRIMIVEDEYWTAMDLAVELEDRSAEVLGPFSSVSATIEALSGPDRPDAVILDIRLRNAETYPVADLLMESGIPFVFATAYLKRDLPERFAHAPIFEKPYSTPICAERAVALAEARSWDFLAEASPGTGGGGNPFMTEF